MVQNNTWSNIYLYDYLDYNFAIIIVLWFLHFNNYKPTILKKKKKKNSKINLSL